MAATVGEIIAAPLSFEDPRTAALADRGSVAATPLAQQAAPRRPEAVVRRGTGVFLNPEPTPSAASAVRITEDGDVTLNFVNADLREVIRVVLGDILNRNYAVAPDVAGTVTIQTAEPIPRDAVLEVFERALQLAGATLVTRDGLLEVVPGEAAVRTGATIDLSPRTRGRAAGYGVEVIPLRFIGASEMREILEPIVAPDAIVQVDAERNLLIVAGTRGQRASVADLANIFDVDWLRGQSVGLFPLEFANAEAIVAELRSIFGAEEEGPLAGVIRFNPVERLNAILAISTQPQYLDQIGDWVERLDQGLGETAPQVFVYYVQNGRAGELAAVLSEIFAPRDAARLDRRGEVAPGRAPVAIGAGPRTGGVSMLPGGDRTGRTSVPTLTGRRTAEEPGALAAEALQPGVPPGAPLGPGEADPVVPGGPPAPGEAAVFPPGGEAVGAPAAAAPTADGEALLPGEQDIRIIADEVRNALVVLATPRDFRRVEAALRRLDIVPLQVLIEATIAEVTLNDNLEYGLQWFFESGDFAVRFTELAGGAVSSIFPGFSAVFEGGDVRAVLNAVASVTDLNVISAPQVLVLDNQTAVLQVGDQVPVPVQQIVPVEATDRVINSVEFRDTGTILLVTPRVNASGLVTLEVEQEVSDAVQTVSSGIDAPTIQRRLIQTTVAVDSGETLALGGLIRDRNNRTRTGVPLLMEIPILGNLFRRTTDQTQRTEILVLITPRVVRNTDEARDVTSELRRRLRSLAPLETRIYAPPPPPPSPPADRRRLM